MSRETPLPETAPPRPAAVVRRNRRWSAVWLVPVIALFLAGWLVWEHYASQGTLAFVRFETATGIAAAKTEVRCRSVRVGVVEVVELARDLQSVVVSLRLDPGSESLLRKGTRFWVVKPRVSASDISGLGTLITGAYIELDPGSGNEEVNHFDGLEAPPVTGSNVPGLRLALTAGRTGSLATGSPIYYRGFEVGQVERRTFDVAERRTRFDIFIREEYAGLVTEGTCFWNNSGIEVSGGADGFRLRTPSFQAMVAGGASFGVPPGAEAGQPVRDGTEFPLFPNEASLSEAVFDPGLRCLLLFDQSVRGLQKGAPVEFRGIPLGRVVDISLKYAPPDDRRIPVLVEIDSGLLGVNGPEGEADPVVLAHAVRSGLRARLGTGSLITGALFVDLDYIDKAPAAELTQAGEYAVLPTLSSGLAQLEAKVSAILAKIEALPLGDMMEKFGQTAEGITRTSQEAEATLAEARKLLARQETQGLTKELDATLREVRGSVASLGPSGSVQGDLRRTLDELRAALRAFRILSDSIEEKPNSLLFGRESTGDPVPKAKKK